jgi:excinuclease UvrABC ATPase subunit
MPPANPLASRGEAISNPCRTGSAKHRSAAPPPASSFNVRGGRCEACKGDILDEPTTGLHFADIEKLLEVLQRLVDAGNTVLVIEHNLDVIKQADWIVDLGPEGGDEGGEVIAAGTPEQVALVEGSSTGQFLRGVLAEPAAVAAA